MPPVAINVHFGTLRDPKVKKLINALGSDAFVSLMRLWLHAGEHHWQRLGRLEGYSKDDIETEAGWRGERGTFVEALLRLDLLAPIEDGFEVPHMGDHNRHFHTSRKLSDDGKEGAERRWAKKSQADANKPENGRPNGQANSHPNGHPISPPISVDDAQTNQTTQTNQAINTPPLPPKKSPPPKPAEGEGRKEAIETTKASQTPNPGITLDEIDKTPIGVAQRFCEAQRGRYRKELFSHVAEAIEEGIAAGEFTLADVIAEIRDPPTPRNRSETFAEMRFRLKQRKQTPSSTGNRQQSVLDHLKTMDVGP